MFESIINKFDKIKKDYQERNVKVKEVQQQTPKSKDIKTNDHRVYCVWTNIR